MRKDGNPKNWKMFCKHIQHTWESETLPQELSHPILVVIPKPRGGQRGIGLLETSWNVISRIINARLTETIPLHEDLHGFRNSRGTGTALCEGKWLHEIAAHKHSLCWTHFGPTKESSHGPGAVMESLL